MDKGGAKAERGYPGPTRGTSAKNYIPLSTVVGSLSVSMRLRFLNNKHMPKSYLGNQQLKNFEYRSTNAKVMTNIKCLVFLRHSVEKSSLKIA